MELDLRAYRRDCWLGALGVLFMLAGDLCLSVIPRERGGQRPVPARGISERGI